MAKFAAHGGPRLHFFNGDGCSFAFESRYPFRCRFGRLRFLGNSFQLHNSSNNNVKIQGFGRLLSLSKKPCTYNAAVDEYLSSLDDYEVGDGDEGDDLSCFRGLVLDISYSLFFSCTSLDCDHTGARPVDVVCWRRAICLEFMDKADVLEYYDHTVSSPSGSFYIPAVLKVPHLLQVVKRRRIRQHLSRKNIFFRDVFTCQYCSSHDNLTIDHVLPISRGGEWKWENLVTACTKCNSRKGQKTLEEANMKLIKAPKAPKDFDILAIPLTTAALKMLRMRKGFPDEWHQYLSKQSLEP